MTDTASTDTDDTATPPAGPPAADAGKAFTQADVDRIVTDRVTRERAKFADYGDLKKKAAAAMSEQERAVADAEARGAQAAAGKAGARLVRAEFRAAAAGTVDAETLNAYLEDVDLSRFVGDDGEPDLKAIEARIKRLGGGKAADFDGGARTKTSGPIDMNARIRQAAGLA
jgi:hypothetical protein